MLTDAEISRFVDSQVPLNTKSKTKSDLGVFKRWLSSAVPDEKRGIEEIPAAELNTLLRSFYLTARKVTGEEYEPDSLKSVKNSLDRYLSEKGYGLSLSRSGEFKTSRDSLGAKGRQLKASGKGRRPNRAEPVTENEEQTLWEQGVFGRNSPQALQRAIWWRNNFFGFRGRDEHHKLRWGDLTVGEEVGGLRFIKFHERDTKTRKDPRDERPFAPKIYETPSEPQMCPVNLLLEFTHRRPLSMCKDEAPFYLQVHPHWDKDPGNVWFKCQPLGVHSLSKMMKGIAELGHLPGRKTNHSGRKTTVKRLREAEFDNTDIIQLTGHKNIQSLNHYSSVSESKQKAMSNTLTSASKPTVSHPLPTTATQSLDAEANEDIPDDLTANDLDMIFASIADYESVKVSEPNPDTHHATTKVANTCNLRKAFGLGNSLFSGASISGGNFNININFGANN